MVTILLFSNKPDPICQLSGLREKSIFFAGKPCKIITPEEFVGFYKTTFSVLSFFMWFKMIM
jgi:hypothetical protein